MYDYITAVSDKLSNQAVACFNLAYCFMKVGKTCDMINMMLQMTELETFITPDMNVYNSLLETGFSSLLFSHYTNFLAEITVIEEFIEQTINGLQVKQSTDYSSPR